MVDAFFYYFGIHRFGKLPGHTFENLKFLKFTKINKLLYVLLGVLLPYCNRKIAKSKSKKKYMIALRKLNLFISKIYNIIEMLFFLKFLRFGTDYGRPNPRPPALDLLHKIPADQQRRNAVFGQRVPR